MIVYLGYGGWKLHSEKYTHLATVLLVFRQYGHENQIWLNGYTQKSYNRNTFRAREQDNRKYELVHIEMHKFVVYHTN